MAVRDTGPDQRTELGSVSPEVTGYQRNAWKELKLSEEGMKRLQVCLVLISFYLEEHMLLLPPLFNPDPLTPGAPHSFLPLTPPVTEAPASICSFAEPLNSVPPPLLPVKRAKNDI